MSRIHGRVVGSGTAREHAEITVQNTDGSYEPLVHDDGAFEIHLPPGDYGVAASSGSLVALAEVADLAPDEDREIVLVLAESVAIQGSVDGCEGPCSDASIHIVTSSLRIQSDSSSSDMQGEFALTGLVPGQAYDLTFEVSGKRALTLRSIIAPAPRVVAVMDPSATLTGGFGTEPGEDCPMQTASLTWPERIDEEVVDFDPDCRFRFEELPSVPRVRVRASGRGWHFNIEVSLPELAATP